MNGTFLMYVVGEINRYIEGLDAAVKRYYKEMTQELAGPPDRKECTE